MGVCLASRRAAAYLETLDDLTKEVIDSPGVAQVFGKLSLTDVGRPYENTVVVQVRFGRRLPPSL